MTSGKISLSTAAHMEFIDITSQLRRVVEENDIENGLLTVYSPHTTAGITINEGADPDVQRDLLGVFQQLVPQKFPYRHREGNSPSHMMTTLTGSSATMIIAKGSIQLGTWQRLFFCEYDGPRNRTFWWKILKG